MQKYPEKDDTEYIRTLFQKDTFAVETTGARVEKAGPGYALCSLRVDERHRNIRGDVMGGVIFTLADFAFGAAANTGDSGSVSLSSNINFLRGTKGPVLYAEAKCVKRGRNIGFYDVTVTDGEDRIIATASINGFVKHGGSAD